MYADLSGGLEHISDLPAVLEQIRKLINQTADIRRALAEEGALRDGSGASDSDEIKARANIELGFPELPTATDLTALPAMK